MLRERTVRPKTSPNTSSTTYPGTSFIVEISIGVDTKPAGGAMLSVREVAEFAWLLEHRPDLFTGDEVA